MPPGSLCGVLTAITEGDGLEIGIRVCVQLYGELYAAASTSREAFPRWRGHHRIELGMPRIPASYTSRASYRKNLTRLVYKARTQNAYEAHRAEARIQLY